QYAPPIAERSNAQPYPTDREEAQYDRRDSAARGAGAPASAPAPAMAAQAGGTAYANAAKSSSGMLKKDEAADSVAQEIGTGHGDREYSPTSETTFDRLSTSPQQVTQLFYDTPQQLVARGIMPRYYAQRWSHDGSPAAFPAGFVPDPPSSW
ncbi:MAG TPA: hypothetical protein VK660_07655, partial [Xanthomonadaceae bacterium]|nr:hypothetical protein [Xanthomonadaceae bacterium]